MKSMKKLIAISLSVVMIVAALATLAVPANAWGWQSQNPDTTTFIVSEDDEIVINAGQLPKDGMITLGGATADADWKYAYPYTLNKLYTPGQYEDKIDMDVYMMYDNQYLYIKEVRRHAPDTDATGTSTTAGYEAATYTFILPGITLTSAHAPVGAQVTVFPRVTSTSEGAVANGVSATTTKYAYKEGTGNGTGDLVTSVTLSGVVSCSRLINESCYEIETKIPWSGIGAGVTPAKDMLIGYKHYINWGEGKVWYHQIGDAVSTSHDVWDYFSPMYLRGVDAKAAEQVIDTSWYDVKKMSFDITTAGQLRGLSYICAQYTAFDDLRTSDNCYHVRDILKEKTVNIMADIDLNPNWSADEDTTPPLYVWYDIACLSGTFNGNGHTIRGAYMDDVWRLDTLKNPDGSFFFDIRKTGDSSNADTSDAVAKTIARGFFAQVYGSGIGNVKNVAFKDMKVLGATYNAGGLIGYVQGAQTVKIENVFVDADVESNSTNEANTNTEVGILIGKLDGSNQNTTAIFTNVVVTGSAYLYAEYSSDNDKSYVSALFGNSRYAAKTTMTDVLVYDAVITKAGKANVTYAGYHGGNDKANKSNYYRLDNGKLYILDNNTGDYGATTASGYPAGWVNIDEGNPNVKMPASVAAMVDSNLWVQERINDDSMDIRVLTVLDGKDGWSEFGIKVEIELDGQFVEIPGGDAFKSGKVYTSINAAGVKKDASELGGKYVGGIVLTNSPKTVKLRITPVKYVGEQAYYGGSSVVSYVDGIMQ